MKHILFLCFFSFLSFSIYSQSFTYKKCVYSSNGINNVLKSKGEIIISDTLITIITDATSFMARQKAEYPISIVNKKENFIQAKAIMDSKDYEIRFTFQENVIDNKKEKFTLNVETKDNFKNTTVGIIYFLIPKEVE